MCLCVGVCAGECGEVCVYKSVSVLLLVQHGLPLPQPLSDGEAGDHAVDLGPPLRHVVLDVKDKRLLAEVSVHNLPRGLQAHSRVQVGLGAGGWLHKS